MELENNIIKIIGKKSLLKRYIIAILGILLFACSYNLFVLPNDLVYGGIGGIAIITKNIIEPSLMIFILSVVLLIMSYFLLGKEKTIGSIIGTFLFPLFVKLTSNIDNIINIDSKDLLLIAIFAGVSTGVALGLVIKNGFTTGGVDILNQIISKYFKISFGHAMLLVDGFIVLAGAFTFGWTKAMYAIIVLYIFSIIVDRVILGISNSKAFYIITSEYEKIKKFILNNLGHGVTVIEVKGGYSGKKDNILMCVVPTSDYFKLKEGIKLIDKEAFIVITDSYEVIGGE